MTDVIKVEDQYYILATAARALGAAAVLKDGDTFAVFDAQGDIVGVGLAEQGLYHEGTRFLSALNLRIDGQRPLLLSSRTNEDNATFGADLTNADVVRDDAVVLTRDLIHIFRSRFLWNAAAYEQLRLVNYGEHAVRLGIEYRFDADYADIFEVRGTPRDARGTMRPDLMLPQCLELSYVGLDHVVRRTRIGWEPPPTERTGRYAKWDLVLEPRAIVSLTVTVACTIGEADGGERPYAIAQRALAHRHDTWSASSCAIKTSNDEFDAWLRRSMADVRMMITETAHGPYPYAGVPWFNAAFGRDGIVTALQLLWMNPSVAEGVLRFLAATQADTVLPAQDAEPGKILHEMRGGEMAALGEVPFGRYYGSIDATPLFVMLAGAYFRRTCDRTLIDAIWPNIERALEWIDEYGDKDGDGFVEYSRRSSTGLVQQGWKDSQDSVFHADGRIAEPPIALCEVQAYVYGARRAAALLARARGLPARAEALERDAEHLRVRFEDAFWSDALGTYALALDGRKAPCLVRASNAGHCLLTGIARHDRARRVADGLVSGDQFSGWGIRTVASTEPRYNPMSYHNGSVWPHDNSLIAAGCGDYGFHDVVQSIIAGLFDASLYVDMHRLPELFCGFHRRPSEGPTLYPVACSPQAWAAASPFLVLQASLGLKIEAVERRVSISHARLPPFLQNLTVRDLTVSNGASVDLLFERHAQDVGVAVLKRHGDVEIVVTK